jgi:hypothetical protein
MTIDEERGRMVRLANDMNLVGSKRTDLDRNSASVLENRHQASPLHFSRFEFKYILSAQQKHDVEGDLRYFLKYDTFVAERDGHEYFVRSLYFDDPSNTAFHEKIDGIHSRSKFRIRTYAQHKSDDAPAFVEIKGRHNNLVFKDRAPILGETQNWKTLKGRDLSNELLLNTEPSAVRDQFAYELYRRNLRPVALIDYRRRPYISKFDPGFRITFDERLSALRSDSLFPDESRGARRLLPGYTVLEVKFHHHMPSWFHRVIQTHELNRRSISKICVGMSALGLAFDDD